MTLAQLEPSAQAPCTSTTLVAFGGAACAAEFVVIKLAPIKAAATRVVRRIFIAGSVLVPSGIAPWFDMERHGVTSRHDRLIAAAETRIPNLGVSRRGLLTAARVR